MSWSLRSLEESLLIGSILVEGSTLTESEARAVLSGRTVQGHPISEVRELLNYRAAVEWLMEELEQTPYISVDLILDFHRRLFQGFAGDHGRWKSAPNFTLLTDGSRHDYLKPARVPTAMRDWVKEFNDSPEGDIRSDSDQLARAAALYYRFQEIHPFEDGNGRIGRILIAYWLHWKLKSSFIFRLRDKIPHLRALEAGNRGDLTQLASFFAARTGGKKR